MKIKFYYTGYLPVRTYRHLDERVWYIFTYFKVYIKGLKKAVFDGLEGKNDK